jgi:hypothetical protein
MDDRGLHPDSTSRTPVTPTHPGRDHVPHRDPLRSPGDRSPGKKATDEPPTEMTPAAPATEARRSSARRHAAGSCGPTMLSPAKPVHRRAKKKQRHKLRIAWLVDSKAAGRPSLIPGSATPVPPGRTVHTVETQFEQPPGYNAGNHRAVVDSDGPYGDVLPGQPAPATKEKTRRTGAAPSPVLTEE